MRKTLTYPSFVIASLLVILVFITAQTYTQLAVAIILYVPLAYFALRIFSRKNWKAPIIAIPIPVQKSKRPEPKREKVEITDIDKRAFLKLAGATGISIFIFSLLGKRVEPWLFGRALETGTSTGSIPTTPSNGSPTEGYKISEIDDGVVSYYGFIDPKGAWLIMKEDTETSSFRYAKGDLNFPHNWSVRKNLKYDYFYKLF